jgi:RNA 2',3'-cyclic 3'-phosphodiesterase
MPRLFTGLEIPPDVASKLGQLRGGIPGARWIEPDDYHVTLRFIGDIGTSAANEIADRLGAIRPRRIAIRIERLSAFGNDRPRSLVARVQPSDALVGLQSEHERLMRRLGVAPEPRKFTPHVTLARMRAVTPEAVAAFIEMHADLPPMTFEVERFVLYSSRDSVGGGPYRIEVGYPL